MIGLLAGVALQAATPVPAIPAECQPYIEALKNLDGLDGARRLDGNPPATPSAEGRRLLDTREDLAQAMKASRPDFARIERLMRDELAQREALTAAISSAKVTCDIAFLKSADPAKQRQRLDIMRPRTRAEIEERRRNAPAPPPPPR